MRRSWVGAALFVATVLLHAAALMLLLAMLAPKRGKDHPAPAIAVVWLRAPEPPLPPAAAPAARPALARPGRKRVPDAARPAGALTVTPMAAAPDNVIARPEPVFDHAAALAAARKLAGQPDPARAGTVGAALDARRVLSETEDEKLGRKIASGKRGNCLQPNGGGSLLTPLMWLIDKKDSGCKF